MKWEPKKGITLKCHILSFAEAEMAVVPSTTGIPALDLLTQVQEMSGLTGPIGTFALLARVLAATATEARATQAEGVDAIHVAAGSDSFCSC